MELLILVAGFIGAWLLVAGSTYQAALELHDQDIDRERLREMGSKIAPPERVSAWWWLLPPVMIILVSRQRSSHIKAYYAAISAEDSEKLISYFHRSTAWMYVGLGGFLLAVKETYELDQHLELNLILFVIAIFVLLIVCVLNTALRIRKSEKILESKKQ